MKKQMPGLACAALLPVTGWSAGGHYPADDADLVAPGDFQIENWYSHEAASQQERYKEN